MEAWFNSYKNQKKSELSKFSVREHPKGILVAIKSQLLSEAEG